MAKMFYTLEEAAERLGKTAEEVQQMVASSELQEFRDGDSLVVKREQVELLAGTDDDDDADESMIPLVDSAELEPLSLSSSGSGSAMGFEDPKEATGISIFDADDLDSDDAAAQTQITDDFGAEPEFMTMDSESSGSGLLDLTREADDTSLGADLLDDVYSGSGEGTDETMPAGADSNLFETSTETDSDLNAAPAVTVLSAEPYDPKGSAWVGTMAVAMIMVLGLAFAVTILAIISHSGNNPTSGMIDQFGDKWMMIAGGAAAIVVLPPLIVGFIKKN